MVVVGGRSSAIRVVVGGRSSAIRTLRFFTNRFLANSPIDFIGLIICGNSNTCSRGRPYHEIHDGRRRW